MEKKLSTTLEIKILWATCISLIKKNWIISINPEYDT